MAEDAQRDDIWGPDDAEVEQWLEEWAEVDRAAVEYLEEAMRAIGWASVPGPDLDRMAGETLEILDKTMSRTVQTKDVILGRPLADGSGALRMQADPLRLPRLMRSPLLELMRDAARGEEIAAFLAPEGPPDVVTGEGHEIVDSTARYRLSEPDRVWTELAERYDEHGPNGLVVLGPEQSIRGHLTRDGDRVVLHAMSAERLRSLQEVLAEVDPDASLIEVSSVPFEDFPVSGIVGEEGPELSAGDYEQIARSFEERWLDLEIPALGGLTPRAAAAGDRRADLVALLDDFEWTQREHPQPTDMDLDRVRRDLGLA